MTTLTKLLYNPRKIIPGGFNIILNLSRWFDMRLINLILSNFIGQLTTNMVEMYIMYTCTFTCRLCTFTCNNTCTCTCMDNKNYHYIY